MKGLVVLLIFGFALLVALMLSDDAEADQIEISSLPFTITSAHNNDTLYLTGNLSSAADGIDVNAGTNGWYLRGGGDTITFNTDDNNNVHGIHITSTSGSMTHDFKIDSLTIIQSGTGGWDNSGVYFDDGVYNVQIYDCNAHVKGPDGINMRQNAVPYSYNVEIARGNYTSFVDSFTSRCQNDAAVMNLGKGDTANGDYSWWIHGVRVDSCPHTGILPEGIAIVEYCTLYANAHNDYYDYPSAGVCLSADNPYQIAVSGQGSRIEYNVIRCRSSYEGGRGIYVGALADTAYMIGDSIIIAHNDIRVTNGKSDYAGSEGDGATRGIRMRGREEAASGLRNIYIYDNYVEVYADTLSATTHIGDVAFAFQVSDWFVGADSCFWYNNTFVSNGDSTGGFGNGSGKVACYAPELVDDVGDTWVSSNNHYISNGSLVYYGNVNGGSINTTHVADTFEWVAPHFERAGGLTGDSGTVLVGTGSDCYDNILRDIIYIGADNDDVANHYAGGDKEVFHEKTLTITVNGNDAQPVENADVWVIDAYSDTVISGLTDESGQISAVASFDYDRWVVDVHSDSVYNPFTVKAKKTTDSTSGAYTVTWDDGDTTLVLTATGGGGSPKVLKGWATP